MNPTHHDDRGFVFSIGFMADDPQYSVSFPDLPDVITRGETLSEAFGHPARSWTCTWRRSRMPDGCNQGLGSG